MVMSYRMGDRRYCILEVYYDVAYVWPSFGIKFTGILIILNR